MALLGSGEFEPWALVVDRWLMSTSPPGKGRVLLSPLASAPEGDGVFDSWARMGTQHYTSLGAEVEVLGIKDREDSFRAENVEAVRNCDLVFFSGGNPAHLVRVLRETPVWSALVEALDAGMRFGGCSAGVSMLGMRTVDTAAPAQDGFTSIEALAYFPRVSFGPHWDALDDYRPGLKAKAAAALPKGSLLVGIDEQTAMAGDGVRFRVFGKGGVSVISTKGVERHVAGEEFALPDGYGPQGP